jgi:N-acetylmuramoyl-L-alanine amidase
MHRQLQGVGQVRSFSQTKVLNLKQKLGQKQTIVSTEAISAPRGNYTNYNQIARKVLGLFIHRTSFFSHLMITGLATSVLLSSVWSFGATRVLADQSDLQVDQDAVPFAVATVASASNISVPQSLQPQAKDDAATAEQGFLSAPAAATTDRKADLAPFSYTVKAGDTVASVAAANGISADTLLSVNSLRRGTALKPGQTITLIPVSGVLYTAVGGESLDAVAAKYKASLDQIIAANSVDQDKPLAAGTRLVVPGGSSPIGSTTATPAVTGARGATGIRGAGTPSFGNNFPWGWCTWYVASKRHIPWNGNAGQWYGNARAMGYAVGKTPQAGAVYVSWENPYYGHVGYVESVNGDGSYTISEMNYVGFGVVNTRTIHPGTTSTIGFVY